MGCARALAVALSTSSPGRRPMVMIRRPLWPLTDNVVIRLGVMRCSDTVVMVSGQRGLLRDFMRWEQVV